MMYDVVAPYFITILILIKIVLGHLQHAWLRSGRGSGRGAAQQEKRPQIGEDSDESTKQSKKLKDVS